MSKYTPACKTLLLIRQILRCIKSKIFRQTLSHRSDSPLCRTPDELMHLKLKTNVQAIGQNPFDNFPRIDPPKNRRKQNSVTALGQVKPVDVLARPFVIFPRADHEFHFVPRPKMVDVRPKVLFYFPAPRRL